MDTTLTLEALIRQTRKALRLTQEEVAARAGVKQTTISQIEVGRVHPTMYTLGLVAGALGLSLRELAEVAGYLPPEPAAAPEVPATPMETPDLARIVAYVESKPDAAFQLRLARLRAQLPRAAYERLCGKIFAAWSSNEDLDLSAAELLLDTTTPPGASPGGVAVGPTPAGQEYSRWWHAAGYCTSPTAHARSRMLPVVIAQAARPASSSA